jgi:hypothetical protein
VERRYLPITYKINKYKVTGSDKASICNVKQGSQDVFQKAKKCLLKLSVFVHMMMMIMMMIMMVTVVTRLCNNLKTALSGKKGSKNKAHQ